MAMITPEKHGLGLVKPLEAPELEELGKLVSRNKAIDGVPDLADIFDRIIANYVPNRLNMMLDYMAASPDNEVPFGQNRFLLLDATEDYSLGLSIIEHNARHLYWHPSHTWYRRLDTGQAEVRRYSLPRGTDNSVVDRSVSLALIGTEQFDRETMLVRNGSQDVLDFQLPTDSAIVMIRLQLSLVGELEWMFDRASLKPIGATSLRTDHSHLLSLIKAASLLGGRNSVDVIQSALDHSNHAVRWAAVQALGRLDRAAAFEALEELAGDPHPHIRTAAQRTLLKARAPRKNKAETSHGLHA